VYDNVRLFTIWEYNDKLVEPLLNRHGAVHSAKALFLCVRERERERERERGFRDICLTYVCGHTLA
jgi:hypothetical protein